MPQVSEPFAGGSSISYHEVFMALTVLHGRARLIRHRLHGVPAVQRPAVTAALDEFEVLIESLVHQLDAARRAGLGPPF